MPLDPAAIDTLVVVIMENRSFDHVLGCRRLKGFGGDERIDGLQGSTAWRDSVANPYDGVKYRPFRYRHDSIAADPPHERKDIATQLGNPKSGRFPLKGFVKSYANAANPPRIDPRHLPGVMGWYSPAELPVTHFLADNFMVCDHWFAPLPASTQPNRLMAMSGQSLLDGNSSLLLPEQHLVYDWLTRHGVRWRVYHEGIPFFLLMPSWIGPIATDGARFRRLDRLVVDVQEEDPSTFPEVIFIEPKYTDAPPTGHGRDDHPPASIEAGQAFLWEVYLALTSSPARWARTAMALFYDEHGGFFDHVQPLPVATKPPKGADYPPFSTTGLRVPALVVSPFVSERSVFNGPLDHTCVLKFLGDKFNGGSYSPAVNARSGVGSLREVFDLSVGRTTIPTAPSSPTGIATAPSKQVNGFEEAAKIAYTKFAADAEAALPDTWHV